MMKTSKPHFELSRIYEDGQQDEPQIFPVEKLPWETNTGRRGFLGAGVFLSALAAMNPHKLVSTPNTPDSIGSPQSENILKAHQGSVTTVAISPDGKLLASGSSDKTVKLWQLPEGKLLTTLYRGRGVVRSVEIGSNGKLLALVRGRWNSTVKLWQLPKGKLLSTLSGQDVSLSVAISPDGMLLASIYGYGNSTVKLWQLPKRELLNTLPGHTGGVFSVSINPDGKLMATGSEDKTVKLWQLPEGKLLNTLTGHTNTVIEVVFSPDGKLLATGSLDKTVKLWQLPEGKLLSTITGHMDTVMGVVFSPDSKLLATGSLDKTVKLWQLPEGKLLSTIAGRMDTVMGVVFSPDGKLLATGSLDKTVKLWQLPEGHLLSTLTGHTDYVCSVAFSPDGKLLASGSRDNTIRLWDLNKYKFLSFLFDPRVNSLNAITYNMTNTETGISLTYTLPCGSPIPVGSTCVCNCISGSYKVPEEPKPKESKTRTNTYCTCNTVCTCIPVCQAHHLLHDDSTIRTMAEEILLLMNRQELAYMHWAASGTTDDLLQKRIYELIDLIKMGAKPQPERWLPIAEYLPYLDHTDSVIAIMAAQMIQQKALLQQIDLPGDLYQKVSSILNAANELHWLKKQNFS